MLRQITPIMIYITLVHGLTSGELILILIIFRRKVKAAAQFTEVTTRFQVKFLRPF